MALRGRNPWINGCVYFMLGLLLLVAFARAPEPRTEEGTEPPTTPDQPPTSGGLPGTDEPVERPERGRPSQEWEDHRDAIARRRPATRPAEGTPCGSPSYFASAEHLQSFLGTPGSNWFGGGIVLAGGGSSGSGSMTSYSGTNNQVDGVDEPDVVKTDGQFIYLASYGWGPRRVVHIIRAYPSEDAGIVSNVTIPGSVRGIFVNGPRLVVLWSSVQTLDRYYYAPFAHLHVYDLSNLEEPALARNVTVSGRMVDARMIGEHVYLIANGHAYTYNRTLALPTIWDDGKRTELGPRDIAYFPDSLGSRQYAIVLGVDLGGGPTGFDAFLAADTLKVYVSARTIYLASADRWSPFWWWGAGENSTIHKVAISGTSVCYVASGKVRGTILNQFSMDEYGAHLRVATTTGGWGGPSMTNNVYVLNNTMVQVGQLEGLAPGESIHSARFMGDRGYLVTFRKTDPFFVIDLSSPTDPRVLGFLKIPGYSDYMHPYDRDRIVGLGKETVADPSDQFSWFQGLKLSLFDAADVEHPTELSKLVIGDRGTSSAALGDHHAFLFIRSKNLLVLPVELYEIDRRVDPNPPPWTYGKLTWMGAYVVSVTLEDGFQVLGRIGQDSASCRDDRPSGCYPHFVRRSLYIGEVLYTISGAMVRMNDLATLEDRGSILL